MVNILDASGKRAKDFIPMIGMQSLQESINDNRDYQIALTAYYKTEALGYEPGNKIQDWLDAEAEIKTQNKLGNRNEYSIR